MGDWSIPKAKKAGAVSAEKGTNINSPERARELQKLGVQKRKENTERVKDLQRTAKMIMSMAVDRKQLFNPDEILDIASTKCENLTVNEAIIFAQVLRAINGDTQAAAFIRDTAGEKPKDQIEVAGPTIDEYAQSHKVKL